MLGQQIANKEWGTKLSGVEIHHLAFLFSTLPPQTGAEPHYGVATVWCHPDQSRISVKAAYKMLESHDVIKGLLMVLECAYNNVKYSPYPFPGMVEVAIADDAKWDLYATSLSNITAWPLLSDKDGKVMCPKEMVDHNCCKCFGMSGKIPWQVKPNGQFPPLTEYLQLCLASKASAEEGMNVTNAPVTRGQSQEQEEEEQVDELADNHDEAGQNTPTLPNHTVVDIPHVLHLKVSHHQRYRVDFVMLFKDLQIPFSGSPTTNAGMQGYEPS